MKIGILALQGSFAEHGKVLQKLKRDFVWVRDKESLVDVTHLIIPGGESTTLWKLLNDFGMWSILEKKVKEGTLKIFGTCAGAILCQKLGAKISVDRNAYGAQQDSFSAPLESKKFPDLMGVFIRAPRFEIPKNSNVQVLASFEKEPVLVEDRNFLMASFHPEISGDLQVHNYFLQT